MSRITNIPESNHKLMDFAGTRIFFSDEKGRRRSCLKAIRITDDLEKVKIISPVKDHAFRDSLHCIPMSEESKAVRAEVHKREKETLNPDMFILKYVLLCFGGEDVCFLGDDEDLDNILGFGQFWFGCGARLRKGRPNRCHANAASLWLNNMDDTRICTGYALSKDGMWRQHSWLIHFKEKSNQIIETTTPRIGYYGFVLNTEQCTKFVSKNYY